MRSGIVIYSPWYFPNYVGGGERLAQLTAAGMRANGADVDILTCGAETGEYTFDGTSVHVIRSQPENLAGLMTEFLARVRPMVVHMVGAWGTAEMGTAAKKAGAVFGAAGLDYGQFCDNHRLLRGGGTVCQGRISEAHCFQCTVEGSRPRDRMLARFGQRVPHRVSSALRTVGTVALGRPTGRQLDWARQFRCREAERRAAAESLDLFIVPTQFAEEQTYPHLGAQTRCERMMYPSADHVVPEPKRTPPGRLVVGFAGRCLRMKGLHVLLDAATQLAGTVPLSVRLEAATNNGEEREYWQPLKDRVTAMPNVEWNERGVLDDAALRAFHAEIDVLAVPSLWPEYVGFVTLEALALGTPVILSDFPSQRELLADEESGEFMPPGDVGALAGALQRWWQRKQDGDIGAPHSPALAASEYGRRLLALYDQVLG